MQRRLRQLRPIGRRIPRLSRHVERQRSRRPHADVLAALAREQERQLATRRRAEPERHTGVGRRPVRPAVGARHLDRLGRPRPQILGVDRDQRGPRLRARVVVAGRLGADPADLLGASVGERLQALRQVRPRGRRHQHQLVREAAQARGPAPRPGVLLERHVEVAASEAER